tara:strand:- start:765 stop:1094 length:330 start_codon:yes stop_codon:yes gene_type:complete
MNKRIGTIEAEHHFPANNDEDWTSFIAEVSELLWGADDDETRIPFTIEESIERLREYNEKAFVLEKIMAWHDDMKLQSESIAYELHRMEWMVENPDREYEEYDNWDDSR